MQHSVLVEFATALEGQNYNWSKMQWCAPLLCEIPVFFWVRFKGMGLTFKPLYGIGPGYLWDHLSLRISALLISSDRVDTLQVPFLWLPLWNTLSQLFSRP